MDSNQVAKASDAARVLKLNTASFSEARNRYTASMPCKSRSRNEVGGAAALGDIPAAAAGTVAFLVAVAMILHLPRRESFRARTGRAGVGPFRFSEATKLFYRWQQSGTRRAGPNRRPNVLKQLQLVEFFRRQKRANLPASLRAGHCAPARSSAGRFRGSRCRWRRAAEPHPAGLPDRRSWPSGQDRAPPGASSPRGRARVRSFRLRPMPLHEFPECGLVPLARKALEKARIADGLGNQLPHPFRESSSLTHYAGKGRGRMHLFPGKPKLWGRAS